MCVCAACRIDKFDTKSPSPITTQRTSDPHRARICTTVEQGGSKAGGFGDKQFRLQTSLTHDAVAAVVSANVASAVAADSRVPQHNNGRDPF